MILAAPRPARVLSSAVALALAGGACREQVRPVDRTPGVKVATAADGFATGVSSSDTRFFMNITGFRDPESVRYDSAQDVFFVSNMAGYGSYEDGNGYISRVSAADPRLAAVFIESGRDGVELNAPKGMAIHGDTLWVADIDVLRGFDRRTGVPLATIDFAAHGAVLLNDVAVAPSGELRVTDTGIVMGEAGVVYTGPDRIFVVGEGGAIRTTGEGTAPRWPNGITWDDTGKRWLVVSFDQFIGEMVQIEGDGGATVIRRGRGKLDGVESLRSGAIIFSSWADSSIHLFENGRDRQIVREVPNPADIGVDTRRNRLAIPLPTVGWVQLWNLPAETASTPKAKVIARR